jgi:hypothetical protein
MAELLEKVIAAVAKLNPEEQEQVAAWIFQQLEGQRSPLTIEDLGWTPEEAKQIRAQFGLFAEDWDDPAMDVYNDL